MAAMGAIVGIALFGSATTVDAQQAARGFVTLNGGYQVSPPNFEGSVEFIKFVKEGALGPADR